MSSPLQFIDQGGSPVGTVPEIAPALLQRLFRSMLRARCLDGRMFKLQRAGRVGFVGTARGLEGAIIGSAAALGEEDWLWSGLREGCAALMRGLPLFEYVAQMYCNANDTAKGRQMCNHFQHKGSHYPSWSSVIGTQIPHGVGAAFASKARGERAVHGIYFGDGATSSNGFHSGLNFAGVWKVPAVFVCIDNGWAISVSSTKQTAARSFADKGVAYGVPSIEVDGNDVTAAYTAAHDAVERARDGGGPSLIVLKTYRMHGHSSSDDPTKYRDDAEVEMWAQRDPIDRFERYLCDQGQITEQDRGRLEVELTAEIDKAIHEQEAASPMALKTLVDDVYADVPAHLRRQYNHFIAVAERLGDAQPGDGAFPL
ncbi:MAG: pyruvate dehydrogenase E1 component alpha subunit [Chlamydiales bacterium]